MTIGLLKKVSAIGALAVAAGLAAPAGAEFRQVDGNLWNASSMAEKRAYMVGVANVVSVNRALQAKRGAVDASVPNNRIYTAIDAGTLDAAIAKIDKWYADNPSRLNTPVLGVVWMGLVKGGK